MLTPLALGQESSFATRAQPALRASVTSPQSPCILPRQLLQWDTRVCAHSPHRSQWALGWEVITGMPERGHVHTSHILEARTWYRGSQGSVGG